MSIYRCVGAPCVCLAPSEANKGCWIPGSDVTESFELCSRVPGTLLGPLQE